MRGLAVMMAGMLAFGAHVATIGAAPTPLPDGCGAAPSGERQAYLGAWIPAALDDPRRPISGDPLGQFSAKAGKGASILIFEEKNAGHVTWVWNVSEKNHPEIAHAPRRTNPHENAHSGQFRAAQDLFSRESLRLWYPGDDVVDWVAVDGYNWDAPQYWQSGGNTWRLLDQVFRPSLGDLNTFVPADKPRTIAETSSNERGDDPGKKAAWICDAYGRALPEALPEVKAVMWFDEPTNEGGWIVRWPVDSTEESRAAFQNAVSPSFYLGSLGDRAMSSHSETAC